MDKPDEQPKPIVQKRRPGRPKGTLRPKPAPESTQHRQAKMNQNRLVSVVLTMRHNRNGILYGPGTVKVPQILASDLLANEYNSRKVEEQFQGTKAAVVAGRERGTGAHRVIDVPGETFDEDLFAKAPPSTTIKVNQ